MIHLPKAYQILSKMQNKSPLQVKSVPSVCSRLPSSPGNKAQDLGPASLVLDFMLLPNVYSQIHFLPSEVLPYWPPFGLLPHSSSSVLSLDSSDLFHKSPENQLYLLLRVCCATPPHPVCDLWRVPMFLPSIFPHLSQLASDKHPLSFPPLSIYMLFSIFCASVSVSVKWGKLERLSQNLRENCT